MVRAGEDELRAAGDGRELAHDEPVAVHGVVVQSVVLLEIARIAHKIVVYRVVADGDVWAGDYVFQVDRLGIAVRG